LYPLPGSAFYQAALALLGYALAMEFTEAGPLAGFGAGGEPDFWLGRGEATTPQVHVAFGARERAAVRAFYDAARAAGAPDNGPPGPAPGLPSEPLRRVRARSRRA
jgi:hypothetical protein